MKLEVGNYVRVVNDRSDAFGAIGRIIDIDLDWVYPYEILFSEDVKYDQELFGDEDLTLVIGTVAIKVEDDFHTVEILPDFINIKFQDGVRDLSERANGCQIEDVIDVLVDRLESFQKGSMPCRENALAITKLEEARLWLGERSRKRIQQGVEGSNIKHV